MPSKGIVKKIASSLFAGSLAFAMMPSVCVPSAWAESEDDTGSTATAFTSNEVVVVYDQDATKSEKREIANTCAREGAQITKVSEGPSSDAADVATVTVPDSTDVSMFVANLNETDGVAHAQRNHVYRTMESTTTRTSALREVTTTDSSASKQYYLESWNPLASTDDEETSNTASEKQTSGADVRRAWSLSKSASKAGDTSSVTIAELDTGVDVEHEDLVDNIDTEHMGTVVTSEEGGYEVEPGTCEDVSSDGHGTHVAGVLSASADNGKGVAGVSYNATLIPINVYYKSADSNEEDGDIYVTDTAHLVAGLSYLRGLVDEGELTNLRVVNMSLGSYSDESDENDYVLEQAIRTLRDDYNVLTVCAGGNGDEDGSPMTDRLFPSDFDESFSVSWLDSDGKAAASADYNEHKDISAPGTAIYSTAKSDAGHSSYSSMSGSSMSAPIVSGAAALLWAKYPELSTDEVRAALQQTAHEIADKPEGLGSAGAVDVADALVYAGAQFSDNGKADISKAQVSSSSFARSDDWYLPYTGSALFPSFTLSVDGEELEPGTDYAVEYVRNVSPGVATVVFTGKGSYRGMKVVRFDIVKDIRACAVSPVAAKTFTGYPIRPDLEITDADGNELVRGIDYIVENLQNTEVGQAQVTVRGIHGYRGTTTVDFWIVENSSDSDTETVTVNAKQVTEKKLAAAVKSNTTTVTLGSKVESISAGAFKSFPKVTKLVLKTKKLTKESTKDALKGSKVKVVQVSLGSKSLNTKYTKKYKAYFT